MQEIKVEDRHSIYYAYTAEEAYRKWKRNLLRFNGCMCGISVIMLVIYIVLLNADRKESILVLLLAIVPIFLVKMNAGMSALRMQEILSVDCDPVKLLQIMEYGEQLGRNKKKSEPNFTKIQCCRQISGRIEEGFAMLKEYKNPKQTWSSEIFRLNERMNYAFEMKDREAFGRAKDEFVQLPSRLIKPKKTEDSLYHQAMEMVQLKELFWDERNQEARAQANKLLQGNIAKCDMVFLHMILAQLDLREKKNDEAKEHLQFVIAHGNTLSAVDEAKKLLQ